MKESGLNEQREQSLIHPEISLMNHREVDETIRESLHLSGMKVESHVDVSHAVDVSSDDLESPECEENSIEENVETNLANLLQSKVRLEAENTSLQKKLEQFTKENEDTARAYSNAFKELSAALIEQAAKLSTECTSCLLYTSDAADDLLCVDLGGRRII
eukprot:TRINITY_DN11495_c0_g1_i3.p2 TRINITY_DN11495_c0_g1~~TRINITY_DN11495_c0_g1_i3.p2  ORF type:complete len:160 (-),score=33.16 TRINITY_DN11495_c0_g1_i3:6-485(-)